MFNIKTIKKGDKVRIKKYSVIPTRWNKNHMMDKWMGQIVTIKEFTSYNRFHIEEESRWFWDRDDIEEIVDSDVDIDNVLPKDLFEL